MGEGAEAAAAAAPPAIKRRKMMTNMIAMIDAAVMDDHVKEERDDMNIYLTPRYVIRQCILVHHWLSRQQHKSFD